MSIDFRKKVKICTKGSISFYESEELQRTRLRKIQELRQQHFLIGKEENIIPK